MITQGDHADEGHRKQWAAELYASPAFLQEHCEEKNGLRLLDGDAPRVVKGFSSKVLRGIIAAMKLKTNPSLKASTPQRVVPGAAEMSPPPGSVRKEKPADDDEEQRFTDDIDSSSVGLGSSDSSSASDLGETDSGEDELEMSVEEEPLAPPARPVPASKR